MNIANQWGIIWSSQSSFGWNFSRQKNSWCSCETSIFKPWLKCDYSNISILFLLRLPLHGILSNTCSLGSLKSFLTMPSSLLMLLLHLLWHSPQTIQEQSNQTLQILSFTHQLLFQFSFFFFPPPELHWNSFPLHFLLFIKRSLKHLSLPVTFIKIKHNH